MKALSIVLALLLTALPLQSGHCGMPAAGSDAPRSAMQHEVHSAPVHVHHGRAVDSAGAGSDAHDCCNTREDTPAPGCDSSSHCSSCPAGTVALTVSPQIVAGPATAFEPILTDGQLLPAHAAPPYRPPATLS